MSPEVTEDALIDELRRFLISLTLTGVADDDIVVGQENRVPEPLAADFIIMTPTYRRRLSTNVETWAVAPLPAPAPTTVRRVRDTEVTIQLDVHGPKGTDNCQVIATLWRSDYATRFINPEIFQPLYASDGQQMPFMNAERQYENRWVMSLVLQSDVAVSTPAQFADTLTVTLDQADQ